MGTSPFYFISLCDAETMFDMLMDRHASFENYPNKNDTLINNLIVNGFKYNQINDHVVCEYCEAEIKNISENERIEYVHVKLSPHCLYANKIAEHETFDDNISINAILVKKVGPSACTNVCLIYNHASTRLVTFGRARCATSLPISQKRDFFTLDVATKLYVSFAIAAYAIGIQTKTRGKNMLLKIHNAIL